jgi:hypothetical protein
LLLHVNVFSNHIIIIHIKLIYFRIISYLQICWPDKCSKLIWTLKVLFIFDLSVAISAWFIELDSDPISLIKPWHFAHIFHFASSTACFLAPLPNFNQFGLFKLKLQRNVSCISSPIWVGLPLSLSEFSISVITLGIGCFADLELFNFADIVEFSELGAVGVVDDVDAVAGLGPVVLKSLGIVIHMADKFTVMSL